MWSLCLPGIFDLHQRDVQEEDDRAQAQDTQGPVHHQHTVHHQQVEAKRPTYREGYCLTSFSAWWKRVEKEERKFYREVEKDNDIRNRKTQEKERRNKEKEMFLKKFFPGIHNSPKGTLNLQKPKL